MKSWEMSLSKIDQSLFGRYVDAFGIPAALSLLVLLVTLALIFKALGTPNKVLKTPFISALTLITILAAGSWLHLNHSWKKLDDSNHDDRVAIADSIMAHGAKSTDAFESLQLLEREDFFPPQTQFMKATTPFGEVTAHVEFPYMNMETVEITMPYGDLGPSGVRFANKDELIQELQGFGYRVENPDSIAWNASDHGRPREEMSIELEMDGHSCSMKVFPVGGEDDPVWVTRSFCFHGDRIQEELDENSDRWLEAKTR